MIIDREALRDALYEADAITMEGVKILNQFPSADVAPVVHGWWITCENGGYYCGARMDGGVDNKQP